MGHLSTYFHNHLWQLPEFITYLVLEVVASWKSEALNQVIWKLNYFEDDSGESYRKTTSMRLEKVDVVMYPNEVEVVVEDHVDHKAVVLEVPAQASMCRQGQIVQVQLLVALDHNQIQYYSVTP